MGKNKKILPVRIYCRADNESGSPPVQTFAFQLARTAREAPPAFYGLEGFLLLTIISGFLFFTAMLCLSIILIVNCRMFYHVLAEPLHIVSESGLAKELIFRNYDCLIDYCSPFYRGALSFPDFPSSDSALSHFAETKVLFSCFYLAVPVFCLSGIGMVCLKTWKWQKKALPQNIVFDTVYRDGIFWRGQGGLWNGSFRKHFLMEFSRSLRFTAWMCVFVPVMCFLLFFTDFHKAFYGMHHIFFRNNNWIFDAASDPVITILPERYFLCCGVGICVLLLVGAVGIVLVRRYFDRLYAHNNRYENVNGGVEKILAG